MSQAITHDLIEIKGIKHTMKNFMPTNMKTDETQCHQRHKSPKLTKGEKLNQ